MMADETIVAVAIRRGEMIFTMPRPARHHHVLQGMFDLGARSPEILSEPPFYEQGFMTSAGTFVDRREAAKIHPPKNGRDELFSEDVW
jgi:hypothetical protein